MMKKNKSSSLQIESEIESHKIESRKVKKLERIC